MLTIPEFKELLSQVKFLNFKFEFENLIYGGPVEDRFFVRITFCCRSSIDGNLIEIHKIIEVPNDDRKQIVRFLYEHVQQLLIHEAKEHFKFMGEALYNEHNDEDRIHAISNMLFGEEDWIYNPG